MKRVPIARECMAGWYVTLRPEMDVYDAIDLLANKGASGAPVVDGDGTLVGVLTEKDCLRVLTNATYGELATGAVSDYMSEVKHTLTPDMDIFTVAREFLATNFAVLPVLEDGKPVGRISRQNMLRAIMQMQKQIRDSKAREEDDLRTKQRPSSITDLQRLMGSTPPEAVAALMRDRLRE
ncbi:MAG: CBS domain-containing protein [Candidatus Hydrogenedentes bacterium]|nr:CBS domain-containing protein [Candidatus Hydrogenedentota bacterium]